jgi:hypothetical protein
VGNNRNLLITLQTDIPLPEDMLFVYSPVLDPLNATLAPVTITGNTFTATLPHIAPPPISATIFYFVSLRFGDTFSNSLVTSG